MRLLNSPYGPDVLRVVKVCFLVFLGIAALAILCSSSGKPGKTSFGLLRMLFTVLFALVLGYQATWQLAGFTKPEFVKFMRRYNRRPNAAELQVARGPLLDCRGMVLTAPVRGDVWGRRYPLGAAAAHPLGYYHPRFGITGVERVCDPILSGYTAEGGDVRPGRALFAQRAEEGAEVALTLDARLQIKAYDLLSGRKGAVIVMRPHDGALLAMVSSPGFNPQTPEAALRDEVNKPAFNRATQGRYAPGSVLKILVAAAALEKGLAPVFQCPAQGYIAGPGTPPIRDSEYYARARQGKSWQGWGRLDMKAAMVHSSNVYFAQLGVACGVDDFKGMMERAQMNASLTYLKNAHGELQSARGNFPGVRKAPELAQLAIGQGAMLVTPLHVACFTAAAAADGRMMRPRLLRDAKAEEASRLFSAKTAERLKVMLRETVAKGTGRGADVAGLEVCGKTGTAQAAGGGDHAWFTCFAPRRKPRLVVTVLIEHGGFGARAALPVARALLEESDRLGYVRQK
ncbi:MAG: penicillin-binding transpeptidase domain-containing protein [Kiritimatiellae bacterium]|nr:penicillin-binding transpeptidase domain-containing protein [Kiritimatiellia bacterium]